MKRSPLHDLNQRFGARFVDFGGWEMPVQFESVLAEHRAVRLGVGVFDVSHLGRFELTGPGAHAALAALLCNDIDRIEPGRCQYTMILNEAGGIIDDLIVWWWDDERFWVMPNAANQDRVMAEFASFEGCEAKDIQSDTVFLAVQGPDAPSLIQSVVGDRPGRFRTLATSWEGSEIALAGTGYTGEPGAEICADPEVAPALFQALVDAGATPCGLGARDTLRLEAGLTLWGEDIDETTTPLEAGLDFAVSFDHGFTGKGVLEDQRDNGLGRKLTGFVLEERGVPRHGYPVTTGSGSTGEVTSGNMSPMLGMGIGMAYLSPPPPSEDTVAVEIRGRPVAGRLAQPPFHVS